MGDVQFILGAAGASGAGAEHAGPFRRRAAEVGGAGGGGGGGGGGGAGGGTKVNPKKRAMARELQGLLSSTGAAHAAEEAAVPLVPSVPMVLGQVFKAKRGAAVGPRWCVGAVVVVVGLAAWCWGGQRPLRWSRGASPLYRAQRAEP
jgi:hypothetical protein